MRKKFHKKNSSTTISWCMQSKTVFNFPRLIPIERDYNFCFLLPLLFFTPRLTCNLVVLNFEEDKEEILVNHARKGSFRLPLKPSVERDVDLQPSVRLTEKVVICCFHLLNTAGWLNCCPGCRLTCQLPPKAAAAVNKILFFQVFQIDFNFEFFVRSTNAKINKKENEVTFRSAVNKDESCCLLI